MLQQKYLFVHLYEKNGWPGKIHLLALFQTAGLFLSGYRTQQYQTFYTVISCKLNKRQTFVIPHPPTENRIRLTGNFYKICALVRMGWLTPALKGGTRVPKHVQNFVLWNLLVLAR